MKGGKESEDNSLIPLINGKTFVVKDGDALLQAPNLSQILSEGRDLYDTVSRPHYRNRMSKNYAGIRMTWLLCGTSSLRALDSSELGERFLDVVIMEGIDDELEDEVCWRVANRTDRELALESNGQEVSQHTPELSYAMGLTGGYVGYLRENASSLLPAVDNPEEARKRCVRLAKFVALLRARPSKQQEEYAERELATRLVSQLVRLAKCLAYVVNRTSVDQEVMARVRQVALDTARGQTLAIVSHLYDSEDKGMETASLVLYLGKEELKLRLLLRFLRAIKVVELFQPEVVKGVKGRLRWRLTSRMTKLYREIVIEE
jgi:hypothetical protein